MAEASSWSEAVAMACHVGFLVTKTRDPVTLHTPKPSHSTTFDRSLKSLLTADTHRFSNRARQIAFESDVIDDADVSGGRSTGIGRKVKRYRY
jgi:hypothetical protein